MDLPNLLSKLKSSPPPTKQFVAVEISPFAVKSAIWQVKGDQTEVVSLGSIQSWDQPSEADLVSALDLSLADAYAGTGDEPNEVIFGLPETWVRALVTGTPGVARPVYSRSITQRPRASK